MAENLPKLAKYANLQIQETEWIPNSYTPPQKKTHHQQQKTDIIIKFWKTKGKGT